MAIDSRVRNAARVAGAAAVLCLTLLTACGGQARDADARTPSTTRSKTASPSPSAKEGAWKIAYSSKEDNAELRALSVASDRDAWAVGLAGDDWDKTFFVHYDGREWRDYDAAADLPKLSRLSLVELASSGPGNTWLFGTDNPVGTEDVTPAIARWDGSRWRDVPLPPRMTDQVKDAAVFAPDDVWLLTGTRAGELPGQWPVEEQTVWHWTGAHWTEVRLPARADAIAGRAPDDIWAVGSAPGAQVSTGSSPGRRAAPAAMHYDGRGWRLVPAPQFQPPANAGPGDDRSAVLNDVVAAGPDDVWTVGTQSYPGDDPNEGQDEAPVLAHWDGSRWEEGPTSDQLPGPRAVAPDGAHGLVFRWGRLRADGTYESIAKSPLLPGKTGQVSKFDRAQQLALGELVQVPDTHEVWGAGSIAAGGGGSELNFSHGVVVVYEVPGG
ncbi:MULTISPECIES: hypothetical protein [unclassified Streptomyces]|uniref:hypothetical protein n=1 Tax=unclassified Streptomyces TaxID=2593676 RepID=UPI002259BC2D|nr:MULTISPECIES: hypothetical protein [unclassified Streptomyces]MCX4992818.1 hypothetical protein [Streptomyces sp. NBC_00568]MCX5001946.1 hypothetical protein [Streptomyces sp. NBC_00638]